MSTCSISIIPKTPGTTVSDVVAACLKVLNDFPELTWELTPMSTQIEGPTDAIYAALQKMHSTPFGLGIQRVYTVITIDERRDKVQTLKSKVESVTNLL